MISITKTDHWKGFSSLKPNKYPAIEENKTLTANPALVISLKSVKTVLRENVFVVVFNAVFVKFYKTAAKVTQQKGFGKNLIIKYCSITF